jgi:hypothetical protein
VPDYSEFPTTPTGWQERQTAEWQAVTPLETEDPAHPAKRPVDLVALVPGVLFVVLAVVLMTGLDLPGNLFQGGGIVWVPLIGAGIALLVAELRKTRPRS